MREAKPRTGGVVEIGKSERLSDLCLHMGSGVCRPEACCPCRGGLIRWRERDRGDNTPHVCEETPRPCVNPEPLSALPAYLLAREGSECCRAWRAHCLSVARASGHHPVPQP